VNRPGTSTTNSWPFPPTTTEVQFDEKWAFVGRKEKNCDPDERRRGDCWDHVALDPESRLVVSLVIGKRTEDATHALVGDFRRRTGGRVMRLMTSDEYPVYATAIREAYGRVVTPPRTGRPGRPRKPYTVVPPEVTYATVHKARENNRVVDVSTRVVFGTLAAVALALVASAVSRAVNTCFVERHNGTDRNRCSRKVRKSYGFSKDWEVHRAATAFSYFSYNFCWPVETLRERDADGRGRPRTPAIAAGLTDHVWSLAEWLAYPAVQRK
jgi:IS1 family transposase